MERVTYRGHRFVLEFDVQYAEWEGIRSCEYYDTKGDYRQWTGEGRITDIGGASQQVFVFASAVVMKHWSTKWCDSFEKLAFNAGLIAGTEYRDGRYMTLEDTTDSLSVIDIVEEGIFGAIELARSSGDILIPHIRLPKLDKEQLRALGLLKEEDGQLRLALCG